MAIYSAEFSENSGSKDIKLYLEITQVSQNLAENSSTVSYKCYVRNDGSGGYPYNNDKKTVALIKINNTTVYSTSTLTYPKLYPDVIWSIKTGSVTVPHNSDGTKTISVYAKVDDTSPDTELGEASLTESFTLTTIARKSEITSFTNFIVEDGFKVSVSKKSPSFVDKLTIKFGGNLLSKVINDYESGDIIKLTEEELITIYRGTPYNVDTINVTATISTYSGSTLVGTSSTTNRSAYLEGNLFYNYYETQRKAQAYVKVDGSYKRGLVYIKVNGSWKRATCQPQKTY